MMTNKMTTRELTLAALFVAITAVCSQIVVPMPLVPFNLAVMAVFLCGGLLPKGAALLSLISYLLLGAVGAPVFAQFSGGPSVLFGMTGGYLIAYPVMAWMVALLTERWAGASFWKRVAAMVAALIPCYLFGTAWFAVYLHKGFWEAAMAACIPFIPVDLCKALAASYLSLAVQRRLGVREKSKAA